MELIVLAVAFIFGMASAVVAMFLTRQQSVNIDVVIDNRAVEPDDGSVFIDGDDDPADWWKKGKPPSLGGLEEE